MPDRTTRGGLTSAEARERPALRQPMVALLFACVVAYAIVGQPLDAAILGGSIVVVVSIGSARSTGPARSSRRWPGWRARGWTASSSCATTSSC